MKKVLFLLLSAMLIMLMFGGCEKTPADKTKTDESLLFSPTKIGDSADKMDDTALVALLEGTLYANGMVIVNWITSGTGLDLDFDVVYETDNAALEYVLVKNIQNMKALKANCEAVFSKVFLSSHVYSFMTEGSSPLFFENDGKLYYNKNTGGGVGFSPDFSRATVTTKNAESFEVQTPIFTQEDADGKLFAFKAVRQNGNWVLDSYYFFQQ